MGILKAWSIKSMGLLKAWDHKGLLKAWDHKGTAVPLLNRNFEYSSSTSPSMMSEADLCETTLSAISCSPLY
jgi:hypothetical protein